MASRQSTRKHKSPFHRKVSISKLELKTLACGLETRSTISEESFDIETRARRRVASHRAPDNSKSHPFLEKFRYRNFGLKRGVAQQPS
jgi:hypothetical protein